MLFPFLQSCFQVPTIKHFDVTPKTICDCSDVHVEWEVKDFEQMTLVIEKVNGSILETEVDGETGNITKNICDLGEKVTIWLDVVSRDENLLSKKEVVTVLKNDGVIRFPVTFLPRCEPNIPSPFYDPIIYTEDDYSNDIYVIDLKNTHNDRNVVITHMNGSLLDFSRVLEPNEQLSGIYNLKMIGSWSISETDNLTLDPDKEWEGCNTVEVSGVLVRHDPPDIKVRFGLTCK